MELSNQERDLRWSGLRKIMEAHDLDVILAHSDLGDFRGNQRYLSGYRATFDDIVTLVFREGPGEMIVEHPAIGVFAKSLSWIDTPGPAAIPLDISGTPLSKAPSVGGGIANVLAAHKALRVGVAGLDRLPSGWKDTILSVLPQATFTDVAQDVLRLRLVKSGEEQDLIRKACQVSDLVWEQMPDILRTGRKRYEAVADIEHIIRSNGCEDSYNLFEELPLLEAEMDRRPYSALPISEGDVYTVEVSPRYLGYYGQQTALVAMGDISSEMRHAYASISRARDAGLALMKPGVDIVEATAAVTAQLAKDDLAPASPFIGHSVGLELEELRIGNTTLILEEGMTLILHPFAAGFPALLRADTYVVTASGMELLTSGNTAPLVL